MGMTLQQQTDCARALAGFLFCGSQLSLVGTITTATINHADILAAVQALDSGFDTTLTAAATAVGGSTTIINALAASIPAPASGGSAQQKTVLACLVLLKRAGLI